MEVVIAIGQAVHKLFVDLDIVKMTFSILNM